MIELRQIAKLFLRLSVAASMLSAVADRFGIWSKDVCMWGNMNKFVAYLSTYRAKVKVVCIAHRTNDSYLCYCYGNVYGL